MPIDLLGPADAANATTARPADVRVIGALDTWFKNCTSQTATDGTDIEAEFLNLVLAQLRQAIRGMAVPESAADDAMLLGAIQRAQLSHAVATGTADVLVAAPAPAWAAYVTGRALLVKVALANATATPTINVSGLGAKTITRRDNTPLRAGDLIAGAYLLLAYDGANMRVVTVLPSDIKDLIVERGMAGNYQVFSAPGTTNFPVPASVTRLAVSVWGGGGSGGGAAANGFGGSGGGGGGYAFEVVPVTPGEVIAVTVGAGGAAVTGFAAGNAGGTSSFGAFLSAGGGAAGAGGSAAVIGDVQSNNAAVGTGGFVNLTGQRGGQGGGPANSYSATGGAGGAAANGGGGGPGTTSGGEVGTTPGGGGAGAGGFTGSNATSGAGAPGMVIVAWVAP